MKTKRMEVGTRISLGFGAVLLILAFSGGWSYLMQMIEGAEREKSGRAQGSHRGRQSEGRSADRCD